MKREIIIKLSDEESRCLVKALRHYRDELLEDIAVFAGLPELPKENALVKGVNITSRVIADLKKQLNGRNE